jgi:SAM-dependent methyltransferase
MGSFEHIAPYYDFLFPAREAQIGFLEQTLTPGFPDRFCDIGCGTGQYTEALLDRGHPVFGLDIDPDMISVCVKRRPDMKDRVFTGDMRETDTALMPGRNGPAGILFCIGNSLVQLTDDADIQRALSSMRNIFMDRGCLVIQIVNFDRVLAGEPGLLPPIKRDLLQGGSISLKREYAPSQQKDCLLFKTTLTAPEGAFDREHDLRALRRGELDSMLTEAGFFETDWFGDFDESPWTEQSPATIVRAWV